MKHAWMTVLFAFALIFSLPAMALELSQARSGGLVGEKLDGYVAVIGSDAQAQELVNEINARRRAEYQKISAENKQPVSVVGKLAAEQIISGLPAGSYYQGADGSWKRK